MTLHATVAVNRLVILGLHVAVNLTVTIIVFDTEPLFLITYRPNLIIIGLHENLIDEGHESFVHSFVY